MRELPWDSDLLPMSVESCIIKAIIERVFFMFQRIANLILGIGLIVAFSATLSEARSYRVNVLPEKARVLGCSTCHLDPRGGGARNPFGRDYERLAVPARDRLTAELLAMDSDGDGFSNENELNAAKSPGDKASHP
jgi:hypothetical protein